MGFGMLPQEFSDSNGLSVYARPFTALPSMLRIDNPFLPYLDVPVRGEPMPLLLTERPGRTNGRLAVGQEIVPVESIRDLLRAGVLTSAQPELEEGQIAFGIKTGGRTQRLAAQYDRARSEIFVATLEYDDGTPVRKQTETRHNKP